MGMQAVENKYGTGGLWGFLQMPFGDYGPQDVPWPDVPIQISKQYYAMLQACALLMPISCLGAIVTSGPAALCTSSALNFPLCVLCSDYCFVSHS